jgi:hypothetical protein
MQNFGRGMWRRVGDYERLQKPILLQQSRLEQWQQFVQYQTMLKKQQEVKEQQQKQNNLHVVSLEQKQDLKIEKKIDIEIEENNSNENINIVDTLEIQQSVNSEPPVVIPKKTKRKNKH